MWEINVKSDEYWKMQYWNYAVLSFVSIGVMIMCGVGILFQQIRTLSIICLFLSLIMFCFCNLLTIQAEQTLDNRMLYAQIRNGYYLVGEKHDKI